MTHQTLAAMSAHLPPAHEDLLVDNYKRMRSVDADDGISRFIAAYTDLSFGWRFARTMHANNLDFPVWLKGKDTWVWKAWVGLHAPSRRDPAITAAMALASDGLQGRREVVRALLISRDHDPRVIFQLCKDTPLTPEALEAYETLFFNVLDRRKDAMFISSVVYPRTRLVEVYDHYLRNEGMGEFLMRAGYNIGLSDVSYWAGFSNDLVLELTSAPDLPQRLEQHIMANGLILARSGAIHQRSDAHALSAARNLIAAAKQGGATTQEESLFGNVSLGEAIANEAAEVLRGQAVAAQQRFVETVIEV